MKLIASVIFLVLLAISAKMMIPLFLAESSTGLKVAAFLLTICHILAASLVVHHYLSEGETGPKQPK